MKKSTPTLCWAAIFSLAICSMSCMTTYDSAGYPVQSVDPGLAVAGAAAAGLIGYALANDNDHHHHHHYRGRYDRRYYGHPRDGCRY